MSSYYSPLWHCLDAIQCCRKAKAKALHWGRVRDGDLEACFDAEWWDAYSDGQYEVLMRLGIDPFAK